MHGLNTYDYGARQYDPARITWDRMDQLCEEKPWNNPYVFCSANPINKIDLDGNDDYSINKNGTFTLIQRNQSLTDKIISTSNNSIEVSRSFMQSHINLTIKAQGSKSIDENEVFKADVDMYSMCDVKGATQIYEFLKNNSDVEWSKTIVGNSEEKVAFISTSHDEQLEAGQGVVSTIITEGVKVSNNAKYSNISKYNTIYDASHTHSLNNLTVSYGDVNMAKKIQAKFPQAKLTIYDGNTYYNFDRYSEAGMLPDLIINGTKH